MVDGPLARQLYCPTGCDGFPDSKQEKSECGGALDAQGSGMWPRVYALAKRLQDPLYKCGGLLIQGVNLIVRLFKYISREILMDQAVSQGAKLQEGFNRGFERINFGLGPEVFTYFFSEQTKERAGFSLVPLKISKILPLQHLNANQGKHTRVRTTLSGTIDANSVGDLVLE